MNWTIKIISKTLMTRISHISWGGYDKSFYGKHLKNKRHNRNTEILFLNVEGIMSRESTPSEFPLVKNTVNFLLKSNNRNRVKSNARSIFSPISMRTTQGLNNQINTKPIFWNRNS